MKRCRLLHTALLAALVTACPAELSVETPDERLRAHADTGAALPTVIDTVFRPMPIDSVSASFAWLVDRPAPRVTAERSFPSGAAEAARQFVRALAQTGSSSRGSIGVGDIGYERAFTYLHPSIRSRRGWRAWAGTLSGIVRPAIVALEPVPEDSTRVFVELLVLREENGQSLLGAYYGHFSAAPGDNGWQLTGARFASEDWASPLGGHQPWRWDRAGAARAYALERPAYALSMIQLQSGEWVPVSRPAPVVHLRFGLPDLR
ncbi:MAG TPA: hypothetical protein VM778_02770 [Gemmatimonadota bacterium]|nr:hypothetical protein [Gemmatimonadota bacterium]